MIFLTYIPHCILFILIHTQIYTEFHTYTERYAHRHTHTKTHGDIHRHIHIYQIQHIYTDTHIHTHIHSYMRTHVHRHAPFLSLWALVPFLLSNCPSAFISYLFFKSRLHMRENVVFLVPPCLLLFTSLMPE